MPGCLVLGSERRFNQDSKLGHREGKINFGERNDGLTHSFENVTVSD